MLYHVNGRLVERERATVSVDDRGFRYGDAAFETCRVYGGEIFAWERHLARLRRTCESLGMAGAIPGDLTARVEETLAANDLADAYLRVSISRGVQPGRLTPAEAVDPTVVVYANALPHGGLDGDRVWETPAIARTVTTRRIADEALPVDAKTHNYLNGVLARLELREAADEAPPADEALMLDADGRVAEGATSNLFFVADGVLKTPRRGTILPGITREVVLELAASADVPAEEGDYEPSAVRGADEAFLTNTTWEIRPIDRLDGVEIGDGPTTRLLQRRFDELIEERCYGGSSPAPPDESN